MGPSPSEGGVEVEELLHEVPNDAPAFASSVGWKGIKEKDIIEHPFDC